MSSTSKVQPSSQGGSSSDFYSPNLLSWALDVKRYELSKQVPSIKVTIKEGKTIKEITCSTFITFKKFKDDYFPQFSRFYLDDYKRAIGDEDNAKQLFQLGFYDKILIAPIPSETEKQTKNDKVPDTQPTQLTPSGEPSTPLEPSLESHESQPKNKKRRRSKSKSSTPKKKISPSPAENDDSDNILRPSDDKLLSLDKDPPNDYTHTPKDPVSLDHATNDGNSSQTQVSSKAKEDTSASHTFNTKETQEIKKAGREYQFIIKGPSTQHFTLAGDETFRSVFSRYKSQLSSSEGKKLSFKFGDVVIQKTDTPRLLKANIQKVNIFDAIFIAQEKITFSVSSMDGSIDTSFFKIKAGAKLKKFFNLYCDRNSLRLEDVEFLMNGSRIYGSMTTHEAGMIEDYCTLHIRNRNSAS